MLTILLKNGIIVFVARECWNWQTGKTKDLVGEFSCGFKSHLPHEKMNRFLTGSSFFVLLWANCASLFLFCKEKGRPAALLHCTDWLLTGCWTRNIRAHPDACPASATEPLPCFLRLVPLPELFLPSCHLLSHFLHRNSTQIRQAQFRQASPDRLPSD